MARTPKDPDAPKRQVKPRPLFLVYSIVEGELRGPDGTGNSVVVRKAEDAMKLMAGHPDAKFERYEIQ